MDTMHDDVMMYSEMIRKVDKMYDGYIFQRLFERSYDFRFRRGKTRFEMISKNYLSLDVTR